MKMCGTYLTSAGIEQQLDLPFWQSTRSRAESISKAGDVVMALAYGAGAAAEPPAFGFVVMDTPVPPAPPEISPCETSELTLGAIR